MDSTGITLFFGWMLSYCCGVWGTVAPCFENRTDQCIQSLGTFIALDKPRFVNEAKLDKLCSEAEYGQRCSSDFLRMSYSGVKCQEVLIQLQIGRSQEVTKLFCNIGGYITDPSFRNLYLAQSPCLEEHEKEIRECYRSANVIEDPELEVVKNSTKTVREKHLSACCPLVQYIECSMNIIGTSCGTEAKNVLSRVLRTASGKQLEEFCKSVDASFPNSPAACFSCAVQQTAKSLALALCYFLIAMAWSRN